MFGKKNSQPVGSERVRRSENAKGSNRCGECNTKHSTPEALGRHLRDKHGYGK